VWEQYLFWDCIPFAGRPTATAFHDLIELFEISSRTAIFEKPSGFQSRYLLRNGSGYKLIDAGPILPAQPLYRFL